MLHVILEFQGYRLLNHIITIFISLPLCTLHFIFDTLLLLGRILGAVGKIKGDLGRLGSMCDHIALSLSPSFTCFMMMPFYIYIIINI